MLWVPNGDLYTAFQAAPKISPGRLGHLLIFEAFGSVHCSPLVAVGKQTASMLIFLSCELVCNPRLVDAQCGQHLTRGTAYLDEAAVSWK